MSTVAVTGYASLDHAVATGPFLGASGTTLVRRRLSEPWPEHGGFAHVTRELARAGLRAEAVSAVGTDPAGAVFLERLRGDGVGAAGVTVTGGRTPSTYLYYAEDGQTVLVYDPGDCTQQTLTGAQSGVLAGSDWLIVTVGPRAVTEQALDAVAPGTQVAWTVKADPDAFPPELVRRLLRRASVVTFGTGEDDFLAAALDGQPPHEWAGPDTLVARTSGSEQVHYWYRGAAGLVGCPPVVSGVDTTGAGDTFVAALVAARIRGEEADDAVCSAAESATGLLLRRAARQGDHTVGGLVGGAAPSRDGSGMTETG